MFAVEVIKCSVGCAKGSAIFIDGLHVRGVLGDDQILKEWVERKASFRDIGGCGNDLLSVEADWEGADSGCGLSVRGDLIGSAVAVEFERFAFHAVRYFEAFMGLANVVEIVGGDFLFSVFVMIGSL